MSLYTRNIRQISTLACLGIATAAFAQPENFSGRWVNSTGNTSNTLSLEDVKYSDGKLMGKFSINNVNRSAQLCNRDRQEITGTYTMSAAGKLESLSVHVPDKNVTCTGYKRDFKFDAAQNAYVAVNGSVISTLTAKE